MARILVIDDEPAIRRILREILEHEKYNVDDAASAVDALPLVKENEYDAIYVTSRCRRWTALNFLKKQRKSATLLSS